MGGFVRTGMVRGSEPPRRGVCEVRQEDKAVARSTRSHGGRWEMGEGREEGKAVSRRARRRGDTEEGRGRDVVLFVGGGACVPGLGSGKRGSPQSARRSQRGEGREGGGTEDDGRWGRGGKKVRRYHGGRGDVETRRKPGGGMLCCLWLAVLACRGWGREEGFAAGCAEVAEGGGFGF